MLRKKMIGKMGFLSATFISGVLILGAGITEAQTIKSTVSPTKGPVIGNELIFEKANLVVSKLEKQHQLTRIKREDVMSLISLQLAGTEFYLPTQLKQLKEIKKVLSDSQISNIPELQPLIQKVDQRMESTKDDKEGEQYTLITDEKAKKSTQSTHNIFSIIFEKISHFFSSIF
ncbi:hypothetical protein HPT25_26305 [Bacillus sp. BRMEA1]|uniref:hypothetical protein n=1 Tax=Neobacillus endophyticus TaxID=2738405 RepID=UPI001563B2DE|nr:hypothetical protein [Neobacillus endophyticus]NRD80844.1 hypothetical protein [Neobacillus endophyticus]